MAEADGRVGGSCGEGREEKGREEGLGPEGFWLSTVVSTAEVLPISWTFLEEGLGPLASLSLGADLVFPSGGESVSVHEYSPSAWGCQNF